MSASRRGPAGAPAAGPAALVASWAVLRRADLRLAPATLALWAAMLIVTAGSRIAPWLTAGAGVAVLLVSLAVRPGKGAGAGRTSRRSVARQLIAVGVLLVAGALVGGVRVAAIHDGVVAELARESAIGEVVVQLTGDLVEVTGGPAWAGRSGRVPVRVLTVTARGHTLRAHLPATATVSSADLAAWAALAPGETVRAIARLAPAEADASVGVRLRIRGPAVTVQEPSWGWRASTAVREGLRHAMGTRPAAQAALVPALVVGDTRGMSDDLTEQFRRTGLTHLSAVSGANLVLMLGFVLAVARRVGVRGWGLRVLSVAGVVGFVAICRTEPSVLRAAAMGLVGLVGLGMTSAPAAATAARHTAAGLRCLLVSMLVLLLVDPWLARSAGFVLSVLATAGIVALAGPWAALLRHWLPPLLRGWVAEAVAVPLAAQLVTQPIVTAISGQVSLVGIVANALAGPWVGPATVLGFATAGVSVVPVVGALAPLVAIPTGWAAQPILWVAAYGSRLPGAVVAVPAGPATLATIGIACLVGIWLTPVVLRRWWLVLLVVALLIGGLVRPVGQPGWPGRAWVLTACDVGQGDGFVVRTADGSAIVVDTGPDPTLMRRCLDLLGVRKVSLLVLSHFHADHVGGLSGVLAGRSVALAVVSPLAQPAAEAARVRAQLTAAGVPERTSPIGEVIAVPGATWRTLGPLGIAANPAGPADDPASAADPESSSVNDASVVGMLTVRSRDGTPLRILFTGDIEPDQQQRLLASGVDLTCDILKVPHHGSSHQEPAFLAAAHARLAIASAGIGNVYGHPAAATVTRLAADGMTVLRTDRRGGLAISDEAGRFRAVGQRAP